MSPRTRDLLSFANKYKHPYTTALSILDLTMQALSTWYRHYFPVSANSLSFIKDKQNRLFKIPLELVLTILKNLNATDLVYLGRTCKTFHHLTQDCALDLGKLILLKKKREEKLFEAPGSLSFFVDGHRVIFTNKVNDVESFEIRHLKKNQTRKIVEKPSIEKGELDDFFFFIYKDEAALKIKFIARENPSLETELSVAPPETTITQVKCHSNCVVIQIGDYLICIKNARQWFVIPSLDFEDSTYDRIIDFDLNEKHLILCRNVHKLPDFFSLTRSNYFLQQCYDLNTEEVISYKITHNGINRNFITDRFIVSVEELAFPYGFANIRVSDLNFNEKSTIWVFDYRAGLNWAYSRNIKCNKYYCYGDRLITFLNLHSLLVYNLNTGSLIKMHELARTDIPLDHAKIIRLSAYRDTVVASTSKTIKIFDVQTGKLIHTLVTHAYPVWINLGKDYNLCYTGYDKQTKKYYFAQFRTPPHNETDHKKRRVK